MNKIKIFFLIAILINIVNAQEPIDSLQLHALNSDTILIDSVETIEHLQMQIFKMDSILIKKFENYK